MALVSLLYNIVMFGADASVVFVVAQTFSAKKAGAKSTWARTSKAASVIVSLGAVAAVSLVCAVVLARDRFEILRLFAYAVFLHTPLSLLATAWLVRRRSWLAAAAAGGLAAAIAGVAVDAFLIEPQWLEVSRVQLRSAKVRQPLKIVLIADFQTDQIGKYERRVLERVMQERPEMILFAGDYIQPKSQEQGRQLVRDMRLLMKEIEFGAPGGVYAVAGNIDAGNVYGGNMVRTVSWQSIFVDTPTKVFGETGFDENEEREIRVTGLSVEDSFDPRLRVKPTDFFHIVVGHAPDYALGDVQADLMVAGHTHGGQVRLPMVGPVLTMSRVPRSWAAGVTRLSDERTLIVSRGVGLERGHAPRLRFLCRPELVVIEITPE